MSDATSENLAKLFMEQVVFTFVMVAVVVVDADSKFLSLFKDMCLKLDFIFDHSHVATIKDSALGNTTAS